MLEALMSGAKDAGAKNTFAALMDMRKIDIAALEQAAKG